MGLNVDTIDIWLSTPQKLGIIPMFMLFSNRALYLEPKRTSVNGLTEFVPLLWQAELMMEVLSFTIKKVI